MKKGYFVTVPTLWKCPRCGRKFRRPNQAHGCGTGDKSELLEGKAPALVRLYLSLENTLKGKRQVEIVMRGRYVLFRTTRIFADLVFMKDALRLAILLNHKVDDPIFFKKGAMSRNRFAAVTLIRTPAGLRAAMPYFKEALEIALHEERTRPRRTSRISRPS
jgi:hypothetical protein